jgi:hypothetical protein
MKPILEWYEELPEPIRSQAIANYDPSFSEVDEIESLSEAIGEGFNWMPSPQEHHYWEEVHNKAEAGEYTPQSTLEQSLSDLTKTLEEMKEAIELVKKAIGNERV